MDHKTFCPIIDVCNRRWFADQFGLDYNVFRGDIDVRVERQDPDLNIGFEIKSRFVRYPPRFVIDATQRSRYRAKYRDAELFWVLLVYDLDQLPQKFTGAENLEDHVTERTLYVLDWTWADQFPVHKPKDYSYLYIPRTQWPPTGEFDTVQLDRAVMHQPKGSDLANRLFPF